MLVLVARLIFLNVIVTSQSLITLTTTSPVQMYNGLINPNFLLKPHNFDCSSYLYSYAQTSQQYSLNTPLPLSILNVSSPLTLSISTAYNHFVPTINQSTCSQSQCSILIFHNCPDTLTTTNYFDIVEINIPTIGLFAYNLNCNADYNPLYLEWSEPIISVCATIILLFGSMFSKLKAFGVFTIDYNFKWIIIMVSMIIFFGLLTLFLPKPASIVMDVLSWIVGTVAVAILFIEILFRILRHQNALISTEWYIGPVRVRILDLMGLAFGLCVVLAWWFTSRNWVLSDTISIAICVSFIKVFKFASFKIALLSFTLVICALILGDVLASTLRSQNFVVYFLFTNDTPFQFQIPVISHTYSLNCSWISVTSIFLPGLLVSYLRRFDKCRTTHIYLITTVGSYFLGSLLWNVINIFSNTPIPYQAVVQPCMILTFSLFACNRKQLRTIWQGTFYDEEFVNKGEFEMVGRMLEVETAKDDLLRDSIANNLFFNIREDESFCERSEKTEDAVRNNMPQKDQL